MSFKQLKKDIIQAMKDQDILKRDLLRTLAGDCSKTTKEPSDAECIAIIKKFIKNAEEILITLKDKGINVLAAAETKQVKEIIILESYLPEQLSEQEIRDIIAVRKDNGDNNLGAIMKFFKTHYEGLYDGKFVSDVVKVLSIS